MEGTSLRNWRAFEKICGEHFSKVVLATTMWDNVDDAVGGRRERELMHFWGANMARGWSMQRFIRDRPSAADVLTPILEHPTKRPLQLQKEVSDFRLSLVQTTAAQALFLQLEALLRSCTQVHEKFMHELTKRLLVRQQLKDLEENLLKSHLHLQRVKAGLHDLKETRAEHVQGFILLIPGLGTILRSLGFPRRPEIGSAGFASSSEFEGTVLETGINENSTHLH